MTWSKIAEVIKRLDKHLSDAVYLHGSYLTGQGKIVGHNAQFEAADHSTPGTNRTPVGREFPSFNRNARRISPQRS
jgi:hypothetical protein